MSLLLHDRMLLVQEILRYISLLLAMQPPPLERPDFADNVAAPEVQVRSASPCIVGAASRMPLLIFYLEHSA
jgi:hypothetical protein